MVLDVVTMKKENTRGQAFVVFDDVAEATAALRALQGFPFFGKALRVEYAKSKSKAVMVREGRIIPPKAAKGAKGTGKRPREGEEDEGPSAKKAATESGADKEEEEEDDDMEMENEDEDEDEEPATAAASTSNESNDENPPHSILYATQLPASVTASPDMLSLLFKQYPGFKEVRLVATKKDIAFIEYASVNQAAEAKVRLDGFLVAKGHPLKLQFAKR
ncbi:hypothetical protein HDU67_004343 [Dinochytrium kinnereticum]|nr:hypothetical protein HDU67_004343 [Dinochytrium kinnereticum]